MIYWTRYIGDFARDTMNLSALQVGIYTLLLDHLYATERPLPLKMSELRRIARAQNSRATGDLKSILESYFTRDENGYHCERAKEEIEKYRAKHDKAKKAAAARWGDANASAEHMQTHDERTCFSDAMPAPTPVNNKTKGTKQQQRTTSRVRAKDANASPPSAGGSLPPASDVLDASDAGKLAGALRYGGIAATPSHPKVRAAAMHGVSEADVARAIPQAVAEKEREGMGAKPSVAFVCAIAERMHAEGASTSNVHAMPVQRTNGRARHLTPLQQREADHRAVHEGLCMMPSEAVSAFDDGLTIDLEPEKSDERKRLS